MPRADSSKNCFSRAVEKAEKADSVFAEMSMNQKCDVFAQLTEGVKRGERDGDLITN